MPSRADKMFAQAVADLSHAGAMSELQDGFAVLNSELRVVGFSKEWSRAVEASGNTGYVVRVPYGEDLDEYEIKATLLAALAEGLIINAQTRARRKHRDRFVEVLECAAVTLLAEAEGD